jgi:mono/diheme cytochrome c family protein
MRTTGRKARATVALGLAASAALLGVWGCATWTREGLDPTTMPVDVRPDYALFAQRCSKCHSLARPLTSGIDDDGYWVDYVARMRRQPASGISEWDTVGILRFLHYFSTEEKRKSGKLPVEVIIVPAKVAPEPAKVAPEPAKTPPSTAPTTSSIGPHGAPSL